MSKRTAIVTGASSGIGLGIVKTLLDKDYSVVACARKLSTANVLDQTDRCFLVDGDVGLKSTGELLTDAAIQKTGRLDLVVNNAGIFVPGNFHDYTEEQYRSIMATNADGFFHVTQSAVRQMRNSSRLEYWCVSVAVHLIPAPDAKVDLLLQQLGARAPHLLQFLLRCLHLTNSIKHCECTKLADHYLILQKVFQDALQYASRH